MALGSRPPPPPGYRRKPSIDQGGCFETSRPTPTPILADHGLDALASAPHLARGLKVLKGQIAHPAVAATLGKRFVDPHGAWAKA